MSALKSHYAEAHADVMKGKANLSAEDQMAEKWMAENKARFNAV